MATNKNITMHQYNGVDYDTLYPQTISQQVLLNDSTLAAIYGLSGANPTLNDALHNVACAEVIIHAATGHTVTITNGTVTTSVMTVNNQASFKTMIFGYWTFTDTTASTTDTVYIDAMKRYDAKLITLDSLTWAEISTISAANQASQLFNIGDTKTMTLDGVDYEAQIIGFNHDLVTRSGNTSRIGITFQFKQCLNTSYYMNSTATNAGGWTSCYARVATMPYLLGLMPNDLQSVILTADKTTSIGSQSYDIDSTDDKLFLLSEVEVFGTETYSAPEEGEQYAYYVAGNVTIKGQQSNPLYGYPWWLRSPRITNNTQFCMVSGFGAISSDSANQNSRYFAPAFCV